MIILFSNICGAFQPSAVGTRVINQGRFIHELELAIAAHDFSQDTIPGQGYLELPEAIPFVSAGVGRRSENPDDYVLRTYRGRVGAFLRREQACPVEDCAAVVDTLTAYLLDPDVVDDPAEIARMEGYPVGTTFVLVTVLAFVGPKSPMSPYTLVRNLAGANREAQVWDADTIRAKARESVLYHNEWCAVAD